VQAERTVAEGTLASAKTTEKLTKAQIKGLVLQFDIASVPRCRRTRAQG
jgi:hypothetical protein